MILRFIIVNNHNSVITFTYKIIKKDMNQFEENNPERLSEFLRQLNDLVDEFHPNIYTIDKVFNGLEMIEIGIKEQLNK